MSVSQLAAKCGAHLQSVYRWEKGATEPSNATTLALAAALNVAPEWLAFGVENNTGTVGEAAQ